MVCLKLKWAYNSVMHSWHHFNQLRVQACNSGFNYMFAFNALHQPLENLDKTKSYWVRLGLASSTQQSMSVPAWKKPEALCSSERGFLFLLTWKSKPSLYLFRKVFPPALFHLKLSLPSSLPPSSPLLSPSVLKPLMGRCAFVACASH